MPERDDTKPIAIGDLYPHLSEDELREVEENLQQYLQVLLRIYERIEAEHAAEHLTDSDPDATLEAKGRTIVNKPASLP